MNNYRCQNAWISTSKYTDKPKLELATQCERKKRAAEIPSSNDLDQCWQRYTKYPRMLSNFVSRTLLYQSRTLLRIGIYTFLC